MYEEHGHEVIEAIRQKFTVQHDITWKTRAEHDVNVAGKNVHVTVDRVEESPDTSVPIKFVRTRFGKRAGKPVAETRELLYTIAYRQLHPGQDAALYSHNMSTGEVMPITMSTRKEQGLYESVEQAIKGLENNDYPARPAEPFRCPTCPFFLICPA
jgi:CRISPR/Cas system-associated exonuclease Cas4 (RecB family)